MIKIQSHVTIHMYKDTFIADSLRLGTNSPMKAWKSKEDRCDEAYCNEDDCRNHHGNYVLSG